MIRSADNWINDTVRIAARDASGPARAAGTRGGPGERFWEMFAASSKGIAVPASHALATADNENAGRTDFRGWAWRR
jgi:hypothetical protein